MISDLRMENVEREGRGGRIGMGGGVVQGKGGGGWRVQDAPLGGRVYEIVLKICDADLSALDKKRASDEAAHLSELHMC